LVLAKRVKLARASGHPRLPVLSAPVLSAPTAIVRRHDPDRFLTALFAPAERREALFVLYAFNHELARAREAVSQPTLALIRLQWWREVVEGAARRHEVAMPLHAAIEAGLLQRAELLALIAGREIEAEPAIPSLDVWRGYLLQTAGGLAVAAVLVRRLGIGVARVAREWLLVPAVLAAAFTVGALAVWLPFGGTHRSFGSALGTAVAVGLGGLTVLAVAIRFARGLEYSLLERALRSPRRSEARAAWPR
jgi:hypothetical protein